MLLCSSSCFGGQTCGDAILTPVMNFVNLNFADKDWHKREAAILAFGKGDNSRGGAMLSVHFLFAHSLYLHTINVPPRLCHVRAI